MAVADAVRPDSQIRQEEVEIHHPQAHLKEVTVAQELPAKALEAAEVLLRSVETVHQIQGVLAVRVPHLQ